MKKTTAILLATISILSTTACNSSVKEMSSELAKEEIEKVSILDESSMEELSSKVEEDSLESIAPMEEVSSSVTESGAAIGKDAKQIALEDANVQESDVNIDAINTYYNGSIPVCKIVFRTSSKKYIYEVNQDTGEILFKKEIVF